MITQLIQTIYWLALSTWFGGSLFIALAAPIVFRTIRDADPILPHVLSVNLENQHGSLLAGSVVGNLLRMLSLVQLICACILLVMILAQWALMDWGSGIELWPAILRSALFVAAVLLLIYDRWFIWPKALRYRQEYIDHADEPEVANPAKEQFDHYHHESVRTLFIIIGVLSLIIVLSVRFAVTVTARFH